MLFFLWQGSWGSTFCIHLQTSYCMSATFLTTACTEMSSADVRQVSSLLIFKLNTRNLTNTNFLKPFTHNIHNSICRNCQRIIFACVMYSLLQISTLLLFYLSICYLFSFIQTMSMRSAMWKKRNSSRQTALSGTADWNLKVIGRETESQGVRETEGNRRRRSSRTA